MSIEEILKPDESFEDFSPTPQDINRFFNPIKDFVQKNPLPTEELEEALNFEGITTSESTRIQVAWRNFSGPVKNKQHWAFFHPIGDKLCYVEVKNDSIFNIGVCEDDEVPDELAYPLMAEKQRITSDHVGPNEKRVCGSNKKYKKCCGKSVDTTKDAPRSKPETKMISPASLQMLLMLGLPLI